MPYSTVRRSFGLEKFVFASLLLHVLGLLFSYMSPRTVPPPPQPRPIHVQFIPEEQKPPPNEAGTIIDAPQPEKIEPPKTSELLASADSRIHSDVNKDKIGDYSNHQTSIPKTLGKPLPLVRETPKPPQKIVPEIRKQVLQKQPPLSEANHGIHIPLAEETLTEAETQPILEETKTTQPADLATMLDGLDASKYASVDTQKESFGDINDGEAISLDTKESKYADYFTRIKHQIEQVWAYPLEAAKRGVSGELTLRFRISREGNLLGMVLVEGSGSDVLDYAAFKAVKSAVPYYPFPDTIQNESLTILATFVYSPSYNHLYKRR